MKAFGALAFLAAVPALAVDQPTPRAGTVAEATVPACDATAAFVSKVWPLIASRGDVIVDTVLTLPYDMSGPDHRPGHLRRVDGASPIWQGGWSGQERPSAALVREWVAGQGTDVAKCLRSTKAPARIIDERERQALIQDWHSGTHHHMISFGQPIFDEARRRALVRIYTTGAGVIGEDYLALFGRANGHWAEISRLTLAQS